MDFTEHTEDYPYGSPVYLKHKPSRNENYQKEFTIEIPLEFRKRNPKSKQICFNVSESAESEMTLIYCKESVIKKSSEFLWKLIHVPNSDTSDVVILANPNVFGFILSISCDPQKHVIESDEEQLYLLYHSDFLLHVLESCYKYGFFGVISTLDVVLSSCKWIVEFRGVDHAVQLQEYGMLRCFRMLVKPLFAQLRIQVTQYRFPPMMTYAKVKAVLDQMGSEALKCIVLECLSEMRLE